jgi:hypothetical protein
MLCLIHLQFPAPTPLFALGGALATVVIICSGGLIQPLEFAVIRKVRTMEFRRAVIACLGVLVFGALQGNVVAIIVSLIGLASLAANPRISIIGRKRGTVDGGRRPGSGGTGPRALAGGDESRRAGNRAPFGAGRTVRPRVHVSQCACGDRAGPGHAVLAGRGGCTRRDLADVHGFSACDGCSLGVCATARAGPEKSAPATRRFTRKRKAIRR